MNDHDSVVELKADLKHLCKKVDQVLAGQEKQVTYCRDHTQNMAFTFISKSTIHWLLGILVTMVFGSYGFTYLVM